MICTMGRDASIHDTICPVAVMSGFGPLVLPFGGIIAETLDISTHRILILHSCSPQELAGATGMRLDSQPSGLLISDALSALIGPVARLVAVVTGSWLLLASCGSRPRPAILATAFLATTFGSFVLALPFFPFLSLCPFLHHPCRDPFLCPLAGLYPAGLHQKQQNLLRERASL